MGIFFPIKERTQPLDLFRPSTGVRDVMKEWPEIEEIGLSSATEKEGMKQRNTKIADRKNIFWIAMCYSKSVNGCESVEG